jgi:hypothetical protein
MGAALCTPLARSSGSLTPDSRMRRPLRDNGLSIVLVILFLGCWAGQSVTGMHAYNDERGRAGEPPLSYAAYLRSPHFLEATAENWESEFVQMGAYVVLTVFLFQRGSAESKDPDEEHPEVDRAPDPKREGAPAPVRRGGWALRLYSNSLSLALLALFAMAFAMHAVGGARVFNEERMRAGLGPLSTLGYMGTSQFWFESLQNWQSEFLAVLAIVTLSIFLRQHGSPESKPVDAPHSQTGD